MNASSINKVITTITVKASELPASCPPRGEESLNMHPRVYLELKKAKKANCPYCGNHFVLEDS